MPNQALNVELRDDGKDVLLRIEGEELPSFFEWIEWMLTRLKELAPRLYEAQLRRQLARDLGARYEQSNAFGGKSCPRCGSRRAIRKEWRGRTVEVPRLGGVRVRRPYVSCRDCGRSWAPYDEEMGLPRRRRYHPRSLHRPLLALRDMSYARAGRAYPESPSPMTLWRFVQQHRPPLERARPEDGTCVLDATMIPGDGPRGQMPVGVAHMIRRGESVYGRPTLRRRVVAVVAGREEKLRPALRGQRIDTLLHDGRIEMRHVAKRPARCRWHIPHMVEGYTLMQDRILGAKRKELGAEFRRLIFSLKEPTAGRKRLKDWLDIHFTPDHTTWRFVRRAIPELFRP